MTPNPPAPAPQKTKTSGVAIAALILGIIGCIPLLGLVGLILGIVGLATIPSNGAVKGRGLAIAGIVLAVFWLIVAGIGIAIAIPTMAKYETRAKQAQCKVGLMSLYQAEMLQYADKGEYTADIDELSLSIGPGSSAAYFLSREGAAAGNRSLQAGAIPQPLAGGVDLGLEDGEFTAACAMQLDSDPELDVWSISSADRTHGDMSLPGGVPYHEVDDL